MHAHIKISLYVYMILDFHEFMRQYIDIIYRYSEWLYPQQAIKYHKFY